MAEMPTVANYLYGIQDETGRAVAEALDTRRLGTLREESRVQLKYGDEIVSEGYAPPEAKLTLYVFDNDNKVVDGKAADPIYTKEVTAK
jgi:hypothetical protein